jgi:tetratricopeptide (TPR) repeat protein
VVDDRLSDTLPGGEPVVVVEREMDASVQAGDRRLRRRLVKRAERARLLGRHQVVLGMSRVGERLAAEQVGEDCRGRPRLCRVPGGIRREGRGYDVRQPGAVGDYRRARDILSRNVASLEGESLREHFGLPVPASVYSRTWLVASLAELGAFAEGIARNEEEVRIAASVDQPFSVIQASFSTGFLYLRKGDLYKAIAVLERGLELCQVWNFWSFFAQLAAHLGYAYALSGRVAEAIPVLEQAVGLNVYTSGMGTLWMAYLSEAYLLAGRTDEALALAQRALDLPRQHNELGNQAWPLRLLGEIAARHQSPEVEPAEDHYRQALVLADELGMRPLLAHCHHGLGTLYARVGRGEQARAELSNAIGLYRAMEMTFWPPQAEATLAQAVALG